MSQQLDDKFEKLSSEEQELLRLRHTTEHVLHTAMQNLYPNLLKAMGPATDEGFYFDFELNEKISEEDFPKIEKEMQRLIDLNLKMVREEISESEARQIFGNNPYKNEWVDLIVGRNEPITIYKMVDSDEKVYDLDLCSGPHLESTKEIKAFKLLKIAGAYWRGSEKNKMLTRIYGTAFQTKEELENYIKQQEEAAKRDHRKLGKELDLFVFSDLVGKGLPMLTPKGTVIRKELEKFVLEKETEWGYSHVVTPPLAKVDLYRTSGHYPYYAGTMYPMMKVDEEELILRPMTCPHHFMLYKSKPHSYKELPVRYAEISPQFRYEKSGELSGLTRVRMFCLADAHIICEKSQAKEEIKRVLNLIDEMNKSLGLEKGKDYRYRLSLGDRSDDKKYYKDDESWESAENILREVLNEIHAPFFEAQGEAAFYGPKIDIQMKKINGSEETAFTVQYDFVMPKRFELSFVNGEGKEEQPIVIHRSSIGAFERTMAFLIEHYAGAFPLWLSPVQVILIPITEKQTEYAKKVEKELKNANLRVENWQENESMQKRIKLAQEQKVPYMVILGGKEEEQDKISLRKRDGSQENFINLTDFISRLKTEIDQKTIN